jgi:peptide-methionine (S)-S-oxide reductase
LYIVVGFAAAMLLLSAVGGADSSVAARAFPEPPDVAVAAGAAAGQQGHQTAVLAGGCFWGMEAVFEKLDGVQDVVSGYSGGEEDTAHYGMIGTGTTGHAESVQITFDPSKISYGVLLKVFFAVAHDPTQLNYQGPDVGPQYRSAIFYADENHKRIADEYISILNQAEVFPEPIVTQITPLKEFYAAEEYHQDFLRRNPGNLYIVFWDLPKIAHLEREFPDLVAR